MADEQPPDKMPDDAAGPAPTPPTRRPNAAASAASRARRIGGARPPAAGSTGGSAAAPQADLASTRPTRDPVSTTKKAGSEPATVTTPVPDDERSPVVVEVPAWLRWVPAGVLSVCALVMLVLVLVAAHGVWYAKPSASVVRDQVLAAAKTCTAAANTYSYQTIAQDEKKGLACSTGTWSDQYRKAIKTIVKPAATKLKASQSIQINKAGIENINSAGTQWMILVYGQTTINQSGQKARIDPFSAQVTMQDVGGTWLISAINTIVNPNG